MVEEFHRAFEHPVSDRPAIMSPTRVQDRARWLDEEVAEFRSARSLAEQADAMVDLIYFALGTMVEMGVDAKPLFRIVHEANMRKLWADGKPRFGDGGKVMKPSSWSDPGHLITSELNRQLQHSSVEV